MKEWRRGTVGVGEGWTYHAKGLWISLPPGAVDISILSSSNYTKRSYTLDLETGVVIVTRDEGLKERLAAEKDHLQDQWAKQVGMEEFRRPERMVSWKVKVAMWIVGVVGGAL